MSPITLEATHEEAFHCKWHSNGAGEGVREQKTNEHPTSERERDPKGYAKLTAGLEGLLP